MTEKAAQEGHRRVRKFADDWDTCTCGYDAWPCRSQEPTDADDLVPVSWTDCDCEWGTSYCDEYHRRTTRIPRSVLARAARDVRGQG